MATATMSKLDREGAAEGQQAASSATLERPAAGVDQRPEDNWDNWLKKIYFADNDKPSPQDQIGVPQPPGAVKEKENDDPWNFLMGFVPSATAGGRQGSATNKAGPDEKGAEKEDLWGDWLAKLQGTSGDKQGRKYMIAADRSDEQQENALDWLGLSKIMGMIQQQEDTDAVKKEAEPERWAWTMPPKWLPWQDQDAPASSSKSAPKANATTEKPDDDFTCPEWLQCSCSYMTEFTAIEWSTQVVKGAIYACPPAWFCACQWGRSPYIDMAVKALKNQTGLNATVEDAVFNINPPCSDLDVTGTLTGVRLLNPEGYHSTEDLESKDVSPDAVHIPLMSFELTKGWDVELERPQMVLSLLVENGFTIVFHTKNLLFLETNFSALHDQLMESITMKRVKEEERLKKMRQKLEKQKGAAAKGDRLLLPDDDDPEHQVMKVKSISIKGDTLLKVMCGGHQIFPDIYILELELDPQKLNSPEVLMDYIGARAVQEVQKYIRDKLPGGVGASAKPSSEPIVVPDVAAANAAAAQKTRHDSS